MYSRFLIVLLLCVMIAPVVAQQAARSVSTPAAGFTVNNNGETDAYDDPETDEDESADGVCADESGNCTLTAATQEAENMDAAVTISFQGSMTITLMDGYLGTLPSGSKILAGGSTVTVTGSPFGGPLTLLDNCELSGLRLQNVPVTIGSGNVITGCTFTSTGTSLLGLLGVEGSGNIIGGANASQKNIFRGGTSFALSIVQAGADGANQIIGNEFGIGGKGNYAAINISGDAGEGKNIIEGNTISGSTTNGISLFMSDGNSIRHNRIGTDAAGLTAVPNQQNGIILLNSSDNTIEDNVISGNGLSGIVLAGDDERGIGSSMNIVKFNFIGVTRDTLPLPNGGSGVQLLNNANDNVIGSGRGSESDTNTIAFNGTGSIVLVFDSLTAGGKKPQRNVFRHNRMYANGDPGIIVADGAQANIPRPVIDSIQRLPDGHLIVHGMGKPGAVADVFTAAENSSRFGEGKQWLARATVTDSGTFAADIGAVTLGCDRIAVMQTDDGNNSSANAENDGLVPNMVMLSQSCAPGLFGTIPYADNTYSVHIDWKGLPKSGSIEFSLNGNTKAGTIDGDIAQVKYNMNKSVVGPNLLTWTLTACDARPATGLQKYEFCGTPVPSWLEPVTASCGGGQMRYTHTETFPDVPGIAAAMGVPPSMAFIGGLALSFAGAPTFTTTLHIPGESDPFSTQASFSIGDFHTRVSASGTANTSFNACSDVDLTGTLTLTANVAKDYSYGFSFGSIPCPSIPGLEQACQMANALSNVLRVGATLSGQITGTATLTKGIDITGGSGGASLSLRPFLDLYPFHASGTGTLALAFSVPDFSITSVTPSLVVTISEAITGSSKSWNFPGAAPLAVDEPADGPDPAVVPVFPYRPAEIAAAGPDTALIAGVPWNARPAFAVGAGGVKAFAWMVQRMSGGKRVSDIAVKVFNGTAWGGTMLLTEDDNIDRHPDVAVDAAGTVVVCWERNISATAIPESLWYSSPVMKGYDVRYAAITHGPAPLITGGTLGTADRYDALPHLSRGTDGTLMLAWQNGSGASMYGTAADPLRFVVARGWNGSTWNAADTLAGTTAGTFQWTFAVHDAQNALIAMMNDTEGDLSTGTDWELFTIRRSAGTWNTPQQLTSNTKMEFGVNAVYLHDGTPVVSWMRDTSVMGSVGATPASQEVWMPNAGMGFFTNGLAAGKDTMVLVWNEGAALVMSSSPVAQRSWSTRSFVRYTADVQRSAEPHFDPSGTLHIGYQESAYGTAPSDSGVLHLLSLEKRSSPLGVRSDTPVRPQHFALYDAFPNPFNPSTTIRFRLSTAGHTVLIVRDILGREVSRLTDERLDAGEHERVFQGEHLSSGLYFYTLMSAGEVVTKKMMLVK